MINLIPPHARKQVKFEYWVRVVSVWVLLIATALLIVGFLLVPSYVLIQSQLAASERQYQEAVAGGASYAELEEEVAIANKNAAKLLSGGSTLLFTSILDELELVTDDTITLTSIDLKRTESNTVESMSVRGVADSRIDLVAYRDAIEAHNFFTSAELPIENLAKDKDVPFNITVVLKQPK